MKKEKKQIFFTARRLAFEYFKGHLEENFNVYSKCTDKYCINPDHHYLSNSSAYLKKLAQDGLLKGMKGLKHSPETIAKMPQAKKGKKLTKKTRLIPIPLQNSINKRRFFVIGID